MSCTSRVTSPLPPVVEVPSSKKKNTSSPRFILSAKSISPIFHRSYPPISPYDTLIVDKVTGKQDSVHGKVLIFRNSEITKVYNITHRELLGNRRESTLTTRLIPVYIEYTKNNKPIIQQQATRGCTAAAVAMLLKEHKKDLDFYSLRSANLGTTEKMVRWILARQLKPVVTHISKLSALIPLINRNGSAIISLSGDFGGHVVVLDYLDQTSARLRDPYHGWEISVPRSILESYFTKDDVIQIEQRS
jgi:hypothetical protein